MEEVIKWQSATPMPSLANRQKNNDWEDRQRMKEYRVASRRERRNRKADEKKQRTLNAQILRRMTRNPEKYSKNAERNRLRDIESERRNIYTQAIRQARELAIVHDPSGKLFNIGAVKRGDDGRVVPVEQSNGNAEDSTCGINLVNGHGANGIPRPNDAAAPRVVVNGVERHLSQNQQRKLDLDIRRPPPPKPIIPSSLSVPEGEEDYLALWDLDDDSLWQRIVQAKREKVQARKDLRKRQQSGKAERRAARDEKRRVYRVLKLTWRNIKAEETANKKALKKLEEEEARKLGQMIAEHDRRLALEFCESLGFTLDNTDGVDDIKPKIKGTGKNEFDLNDYEVDESTLEVRQTKGGSDYKSKRRIDLSTAAVKEEQYLGPGTASVEGANQDEFLALDVGEGVEHTTLPFNHKLRRKIKRAFETAQIEKELLVRQRARQHCEQQGIPIPALLNTPTQASFIAGPRQLASGLLETAKQERIRKRLELTEFNNAAKVLRAQAKALATEAGLRVYAENMGRIPPRKVEPGKKEFWGVGWHVENDPNPMDFVRTCDVAVVEPRF